LTRGRVVKHAATDAARVHDARGDDTHVDARPPRGRARRVDSAAVDEYLRANAALASAKEMADAIVHQAWADAAAAAGEASRAAQKDAEAKLAAAWLALKKREEEAAEGDVDRAVTLAVALAERLVGAAVALDPKLVASLAKNALAEARGARRALIEAHPNDIDALRANLAMLPLAPASVELRADASLARGDLRLHTDLGTLDAKLHPRLERLAAALRDALR
jgi:flagellar biosynthesis/type III secretory pathway protein FliH